MWSLIKLLFFLIFATRNFNNIHQHQYYLKFRLFISFCLIIYRVVLKMKMILILYEI